MPMAGSNSTTQNVNSGGTSANPGAGAVANNNVANVGSNKTWELSDYELHRTPQDAVTDGSEIAVSPRALHSELMCPICLDMLHQTMTTKECLHRFCAECIITALRSGNKECPTCRKKLVSKRSLRPDPNFDMLISKIYPSRDEYEAQQQKAMARLSKSHNQLALASSIEEGMKAQSQNRKVTKPSGKGNGSANQNQPGINSDIPDGGSSNNAEGNSTNNLGNTAVVGNNLSAPGVPNASLTNNCSVNINTINGPLQNNSSLSANSNAVGPVGTMGMNQLTLIAGATTATPTVPTNTTTTLTNHNIPGASNSNPSHLGPSPTKASRTDSVGGDNSSNTSGFSDEVTEVELVFKPHPDMFSQGSIPSAYTQTRYIKTSANASVEHLTKYLGMRLALDSQMDTDCDALHNCTIYVSPNGSSFVAIPQPQTLTVVCEKFWRFNKPLEMYYSWKKIN